MFFGILVVLVTEGEGQELLPVAVLLFLEHVLVGIAQHNRKRKHRKRKSTLSRF